METKIINRLIRVEGMSCASCELKIVNALKKINGVKNANASFSKSEVKVSFDESIVNPQTLVATIKKLGYNVVSGGVAKKEAKLSISQLVGIGIIIFALYIIIKNTVGFNYILEVDQSMGYGILFIVGLLTSLHCVAMCGGINISQCVSNTNEGNSKLKPSLLYNLGRVISYTIIGGIVGAIGSVVSFSGATKGIVVIISGAFMLVMGLNMLNIFPWLKRFNPRMPKIFGYKVYNNNAKRGPLYVGLLTGLMPCGPLQAMQLYALGTGSFVMGATSMMIFSLGTVPLMFGLGAVSTLLSSKFTHRLLKASAVLVMILGIIMINRGLNLSGISFAQATETKISKSSGSIAKIEGKIQVVKTNLKSGSYEPIVVQKGIPVRWIYTAEQSEINGCNKTISIRKYGIQKNLVAGDNIIEFTPGEEGVVPYTCWMGMISSSIKIVDDITKVSGVSYDKNTITQATGGCCGQ